MCCGLVREGLLVIGCSSVIMVHGWRFCFETFVFWFMLLFHLLRKMSSAREATGSYSVAGSISRYCSYEVIKNAPGSRIDVAGNHGVSIDGNPRKIKCKYY